MTSISSAARRTARTEGCATKQQLIQNRRHPLYTFDYLGVRPSSSRTLPFLWFLDGKIAGSDEVLAKAKKDGRLDYDAPMEGLKALDRYTLQITLKEPDYVLHGFLTQSSMAAVARAWVEVPRH